MRRSPSRHLAGSVAATLLLIAGCAGGPPSLPAPQWQLLPAPTTASLRGLAALDGQRAWVTGSGGTVLRTTDGGLTWRQVGPPERTDADFRDVVAFDADTAVVMIAGAPAELWRTADGGASWQRVFAEPAAGAFFDALAAAGEDVVLFGDPIDNGFYVVVSRDRGRTWTRVEPRRLPAPEPGEAAFAASGSCVHAFGTDDFAFVTGGSAVRFVHKDPAGARAVPLPLANGAASRGAFSVAFAGRDRVLAVGGDYAVPGAAGGTAAWSEDGGRTWHEAGRPPDGYRSAVVWTGAAGAVAAGPLGCSASGDGGRTWQSFGESGFHCLCVAGDALWAAGANGRVARAALRDR